MTENPNADPALAAEELPIQGDAKIVPLGIDDIDKIIAFDELTFFDANPDTPKDHAPLHFTDDEIKEGIERGDILEAVVDEEGNFVGDLWFEPKVDDNELYVYSLAVHPDYRDQGLGDYFLRRAETIAKQRGFGACSLHVDPLNGRGMHLYTRHGYKATEYETDPTDGLDNWLHMVKPLAADWEVDEQDVKVIEAGDAAGLQAALDAGYISTGFEASPDKNPYKNLVKFAKRLPD